MPDLPMFFPVCDYSQTHSPWGLFTVCLPWGLTLFLLFELIMRQPLIALLPTWVALRIPNRSNMPDKPQILPYVRYFFGAAIAVTAAAFSHQIWDAFSHKGRWGTELLPILNAEFTSGSPSIPGYKLVQYGSTFIGLPLLMFLAGIQLRNTKPDNHHKMLQPRTRILATVLLACVPLAIGTYSFATYESHYLALGNTITSSGTIIAAGLITYSLLFSRFSANA